jgi:hypothetical protein
MSEPSRCLSRCVYRSTALISLNNRQTVRPRGCRLECCRSRGSLHLMALRRTVRTVVVKKHREIKGLSSGIGRYDGRYMAGTAGQRP